MWHTLEFKTKSVLNVLKKSLKNVTSLIAGLKTNKLDKNELIQTDNLANGQGHET